MWTTEHSIEAPGSPEAIWRVWADVPSWGEWNNGHRARRDRRPVRLGQHDHDDAARADPVELELAEAVEPQRFVDGADLGDVVVRTLHEVVRLDDQRLRVTYRMEISGPAADTVGPELGPAISADFPDVLAALVERAQR